MKMEKHKILNFFVMAVALIIMAGCGQEEGKVAEEVWIELDRHIVALVIPEQVTLTATVKDVTWSSSNDAVATVDNNGKVTAVSEGTANITATIKGSKKTAICTVIVTSSLVQVTGITLSPATLELKVNGKASLQPTISPNNATFKVLIWTSSNSAAVSVDKNGGLTAVALGSATITGTAIDGSNKTVTCEVKVVPTLVTDIELDKSKLELKVTEKVKLNAKVVPDDATVKTLVWSSSDEKVAIVNQNGEVTALAGGTATITVSSTDGSNISKTCEVTVVFVQITGIELDKSNLELKVTEKVKLNAKVVPDNASISALLWASSDEKVATVNQSGEVTALAEGVADITATSTDGSNIKATCKLTVVTFELVINGDFKTDDLKTSFFFTSNANPVIVNDDVKGRVMKIESPTKLTNDWDLQFWVIINPRAKLNEQYVFTMDVRSEKNCSFPTQSHDVPMAYIHWDMVGSIASTTGWSTYTKTITIDANRVGSVGSVGAIAFNLGQIETTVYITNVSLKRIK